MRATAAFVALLLAASPCDAQDGGTAPGEGPAHSAIHRATVRVFAIRGVDARGVRSSSEVERLLATPDAGHGSGLLLDDGIVLTARHVVEGARLLAVWVPGQPRALPAQLVYASDDDDLAFLAIEHPVESALTLPESVQLHVQQPVHAIGYPIDARRRNPQTSRGVVAGVLESGPIQLDVTLDPGNGGGPLLDEDENVVGMVVTRGDPTVDTQGIGFAVPLAPIHATRALHVTPAHIAEARQRLAAQSNRDAVAELVHLLVQIGGSQRIREVSEVVDPHRSGGLVPRLRELAEGSDDALVLAMVAAYLWDVGAVALERAGGHMRASQVEDRQERARVRDLLDSAVQLCRRSAELDSELAYGSRFVAYVLQHLSAARPRERARAVPFVVEDEERPPLAASAGWSASDAADAPRAHRWFALRAGFALPAQARSGFGLDGIAVTAAAVVRPWVGWFEIVAFAPYLAIDTAYGGWSGEGLVAMNLEVGAQLRLGSEEIAFAAEGGWAPGIAIVPGPSELNGAAWAAAAGVYFGQFAILASWRGMNRPNGFSLHLFQLFVEFTP